MNTIAKFAPYSFPAILGLSAVWIVSRIINNEHKLIQRELELEIQLSKTAPDIQ
tara:strand:- start:256 stop:417 length:162 start_codon:yes stop_codon:yes gene_type:complete